MEPVVYEESPLADYLRDGGEESHTDWAPASTAPDRGYSSNRSSNASPGASPPYSPSPFAPTGRPLVKARFRNKIPTSLSVDVSRPSTLRTIRQNCSAAVAASIDRADNAKFLEQFRYTIVASQLLSGHSMLGAPSFHANTPPPLATTDASILSAEGLAASVLGALAIAILMSWMLGSGVTRKRLFFLICLCAAGLLVGQVYMKRQWLRYRREQSISEVATFVANSHHFDSAAGAALSLVQEVELVSRGYRISAPLPPISRIEDRSQSRKCVRLRKALKTSFSEVLETYKQVCTVVRAYAEQTDLEKYYDIYDISDFDMSDAQRGFNEDEFDDQESLRTLKILAARFHTVRKMFLCALLALDASGEDSDLLRWTTAVEAISGLNTSTESAYKRMQSILSEEQMFQLPPTPKNPLTPGRERWRSQLRKLNSLSTGIRGLQAKLQLLREESDRALDDSNDISELGPSLMSQYDAIGTDLKELMSAWEEGKAALAMGIDRNEKRLSSISTLISPASSLSGLTTVDEVGGTASDALKALTGESPPASDNGASEDTLEVFEAVAQPRPRSMFTREERIIKMREEREQKAHARQQFDATKGMLRELETVINLRPRTRTSAPPGSGRIVSM